METHTSLEWAWTRPGALALGCAVLLSGCTFHHSVAVRYTPMVNARRLADATQPETIVVGPFVDARAGKSIGKERLNPISVHKMEYETVGDVPEVFRAAFADALLKSGFVVPAEVTGEPTLSITGKIVTYAVDLKSHWSTVEVAAEAGVELSLTHKDGRTKVLAVAGKSHEEAKGGVGTDAMAAGLDSALRDCVSNFLRDEGLVSLLGPPSP